MTATSAPREEDVRPGATATTGCLCLRTGWWQCVDEGEIQGGRRQYFKTGQRMPHAVFVGKRTVWQQLTGAPRPTHQTVTVWTLVECDPPPALPAPALEQQTRPESNSDKDESTTAADDEDEAEQDDVTTAQQGQTA